ncbi:unnamed protein product, partial [Ilex paraguariensis]
MTEENRGLMGKNTFLSNDMVCKSSNGTAISKTPMIVTDNTELLKYCAVGLTGSDTSSSSNSISEVGVPE